MYAPYRKPHHEASIGTWNECILNLRAVVDARMLRPCACQTVISLRMLAGIELARAIVYLKMTHEASHVAGTCPIGKRAAEHFKALDLVVDDLRVSGDSNARSFQQPPLTLGEICFFLSIGTRSDTLRIGRPLSSGVVSVSFNNKQTLRQEPKQISEMPKQQIGVT